MGGVSPNALWHKWYDNGCRVALEAAGGVSLERCGVILDERIAEDAAGE